MATQLASGSMPAIRRARVEHERGSAPEVSDLFARVTSIRSETFDLVEDLSAASLRHGPEFEEASGQMQSIANQLGAIQALIQGLDAY
jgi:hypothetical protein